MRPVLQRHRPRPEPGLEHARIAAAVTDRPAALLPPVVAGSRACCCSAAPAFQVVLPRADRSASTEFLFCGHHYRQHRDRLLAQGAATYDRAGWPVDLPE
jgi:hypothetical protein